MEENAIQTTTDYAARISELEKIIRKKDREISRLQVAIEQEKIFANARANMFAAQTMAQRIRDRYLQLLLENSLDIIICFDHVLFSAPIRFLILPVPGKAAKEARRLKKY